MRHILKGRQRGNKASGPDVITRALAQGDPGVWHAGQPSHRQSCWWSQVGTDSVQGVLATWLNQDFICLPADEDLNLLETVFS